MFTSGMKHVAFDEYCPKCRYYNTNEDESTSPCSDCLLIPAQYSSQKPINFKEKNVK